MKKKIRKITSGLFFILLLLAGCTKYEPVQDDYVLQVKNVGLRKGVFIRRYQLTGEFGRHNNFTPNLLKKFIKKTLEPNYLFIQHAYDLGMHQEKGTARKIKEYRMNLLADSHPYKFEPMTISKNQLQDFYEKKSVAYDVDVIQTDSYHSADSLYGILLQGREIDRPDKMSGRKFPQYYRYKNVSWGEALHPEIFMILERLKAGEISKPVSIASIWTIIRLNRKGENNARQSFEKMKKKLLRQAQAVLKYEQQKKLVSDLREKYPVSIQKRFYPSILVAYRLADDHRFIDKGQIEPSDLEATFLKIGNDAILLSDFITRFNQANQFFQISRLSEKDLNQFAEDYAAHYLFYLDACEKKIEQTPLVADKLVNKEHRILLNRYLNEEIARKVVITDADARKYYTQTRDKWEADYKKVAGSVRNELKNKRMVERKNELVKKLQKEYTVRYNEPLLQQIAEELTREKMADQPKTD